MSRATTDVLLFLILLVALAIHNELLYGADAPEGPPLFIYGVGLIGAITVLVSLATALSQSDK